MHLFFCSNFGKSKKNCSDSDYCTSSGENQQGRGRHKKRPTVISDSQTSLEEEPIKNSQPIPRAGKCNEFL